MSGVRGATFVAAVWMALCLTACGRSAVVAETAEPAGEQGADEDAELFDFDPDRPGPQPGNNGPANNGPANNGPANNGDPPPLCEPGESRCDGDIQVVCTTGGRLQETFCQNDGAFCEVGRGSARCREWVCDPGSSRCLDARTVGVCNERGSEFAFVSPCDNGCDPQAAECREAPAGQCEDEDAIAVLEPGATQVDLCATEDRQFNVQSGDCGADGRRFAGRDATFRLVLDAPSLVNLDLRDADEQVAIDTVLYVQSTCGAVDSQIACHDDLECEQSDIEQGCDGGRQVRHSRLELRLDAGEYFVVADQYTYDRRGSSFACGDVTLTLGVRELDD